MVEFLFGEDKAEKQSGIKMPRKKKLSGSRGSL